MYYVVLALLIYFCFSSHAVGLFALYSIDCTLTLGWVAVDAFRWLLKARDSIIDGFMNYVWEMVYRVFTVLDDV